MQAVSGGPEVLLQYDDFRKVAGRMSSSQIDDVAAKIERGEVLDVSLTKSQV